VSEPKIRGYFFVFFVLGCNKPYPQGIIKVKGVEKMASTHQLESWIKSAGQGDRNALEKLYDAAAPAVYAMALSILKNEADAEDVLQETFMAIMGGADRYQSQGKPMAWIITIAKNRSYKLHKQNHRYLSLAEENLPACVMLDPDDRILLQSCIKLLSEEEQQIVIFHAVAGCKHRKIAEMLDLPLSTVLSKYHRALKKLRTALDQEVQV
jgi:RNA polymerase sigma-70 factor (ECF subfamily)